MKRSTDSRAPAGELPSFLDHATGKEDSVAELAAAPVDEPTEDTVDHEELEGPSSELDELEELEEDEFEEDEEDGDGELDEGDEWDDEDAEDDGEEDDDLDDVDPVARGRRASNRSGRRKARSVRSSTGGGLAMVVGLIVTSVAFIVSCTSAGAAAAVAVGVEPQIALLVGIAVFAIGANQHRVGRMSQRFDELAEQQQQADEELRNSLAQLMNSQPGSSPTESGDLQGVLLSLQRQDQKINNLTKAIKMYGKPLMEIAGQGTELAGSVAQTKTLIEGGTESTRLAMNRLEDQLKKGGAKADLGSMPEQVGRLEVSLAAVTQRLEDNEVRKSLVRLEDVSKDLQTELQNLQRGDNIRAATSELQQRIDKATQGLTAGIEGLRDGNLGGLETTVREIQREVAGLATSLAQIQAAVKSGAGMASASRAAAPAAAARTAAPAAAPAGGAAKPAAGGKAAGGKAAGGKAAGGKEDDGEGYQTGKRSSAGKNVLGAIAKLKQMKG